MRSFGNTPVVQTSANGQPAVALYPATADGQHRLHALHVLTFAPHGINHVVSFQDVEALRRFGLPRLLSTQSRD
jgi:RNA polymerase sigma-70 factor (ECF subfamily)